MSEQKELEILEILSEYKWDQRYSCCQCGHNEYKKGKKEFSRRCKKCDYDESLFKFTAFEGVKLPAEKIYGIVEYMVDQFAGAASTKINVSRLANKVETEENTILKFIGKIDERLRQIDEDAHLETPVERLSDYLLNFKPGLNYLVGLMMFPLRGSWHGGETKVNDKWYILTAPSFAEPHEKWSISLQIFCRAGSDGKTVNYYNKEGEPEYICIEQ